MILNALLLFGIVVLTSLIIVGIPASALKSLAVAVAFGLPGQKGLARRSALWGALVGITMIVLQMVANYSALRFPDWRAAITALGGWQWTAIGFAVLAALAIAVDYWMVLRRLQPRLTLLNTACFLAFSNIWVIEGAWLLGTFNQMTLFPSCYDATTKRIVSTFSEPRPADCSELSD